MYGLSMALSYILIVIIVHFRMRTISYCFINYFTLFSLKGILNLPPNYIKYG